jgi:periplasmic divalent cation tolerance protein
MSGYLQVSTATATREEAVQLAGSAVGAGLAAGAQVLGPVVSVFWHDGKYGEGEEWQVLLKPRSAGTPSLNLTCWRSTRGAIPR